MLKKKLISLLVAGAMVLGVTIGIGTGAWFTDSKTSNANVFKTGTLKLGEPGTITEAFTTNLNIFPGWSEENEIQIVNNGSLDLQYKIALDSENPVSPSDSPLYKDLMISINDSTPVSMNNLHEVYLGTINANSEKNAADTFKIKFLFPSEIGNAAGTAYETSKSAVFKFKFTAAQLNDTSFAVNNKYPVIIKDESQLNNAINNQQDGQIWIINAGKYALTRNSKVTAGGQEGWYLPLTANNLTLIGVGNPIIYGNEFCTNGNWSSQDLVAAFGNNITIKGFTFMTKIVGNKTVEVIGANFRIEDCTIKPNTLCPSSMYDNIANLEYKEFYKQWGGSLYFNGAGNHIVKNVTINNAGISFRYSPAGTNIIFDNVSIVNHTNIDDINEYRYSSSFEYGNCSITGKPTVTYLIDNALNNRESVNNYAQPGDKIIEQ